MARCCPRTSDPEGTGLMRKQVLSAVGLLAVLVLVAGGCRGRYTPIPTEGVVTLDGKPVEGITVQFLVVGDDKDGRLAFGTTDKEGKFQLSTMGMNDGAFPRDYRVVVVKHVPANPQKEAQVRQEARARGEKLDPQELLDRVYGAGPRTKNIMPEKYGSAEKTPFQITVPHNGPVMLEMTSK